MKKIIFTLLALVGTMSMNAQVMKIMKNGVDTPVQTYKGSDYYVVFEEVPTKGTAERTGSVNVNWVQLWENGPKFAEYNVGAENNKAEDYGGYYTWGGTYKNGKGIDWRDGHNTGSVALTGDDDTAAKFWGSNWRMPTSAELSKTKGGLLQECDCVWTENYNGTGKNGLLCTGKGDYSSNSVFLPAAGLCDDGNVYDQGYNGRYWSSTPGGSSLACGLYFSSGSQLVGYGNRDDGYSVRAVLNETKGTAKATINSTEVDVNWVQLWDGGPKFAEHNVGASSATETGTTMTFTEATKAGAEYVWGANWCTPSKEEDMEHLMTASNGGTDDKVKCEYTQEGSTYGFKFTGKTDGYTGNSVFFPANFGASGSGWAYYWSATANGSEAWSMYLYYNNVTSRWEGSWKSNGQGNSYLVRPVLKN